MKEQQINHERKLGRGLSALIGNNNNNSNISKNKTSESSVGNIADDHENVDFIDVSKIVSGVYQPRKYFDHDELADLSKSIKENGVIQPIIVRKADEARGIYEIIAGERRFRASKMAGLTKVPAIVKHVSNTQALEFAIVENVQRADLSAIEEANSYKQLMAEFNYTQEEVSKKIGHSRSRVANILRLLSLPKKVQDMIDKDQISVGHARALIGRDDAIEIANKIVEDSLSVRDVEDIINHDSHKKPTNTKAKLGKRAEKTQRFKDLEHDFSKACDLKVKINFDDKKHKGKITIFYDNPSVVEQLIKKLK